MKFEFTERDLIILNEALIQMPYGKVVELIEKINRQIVEQRQKAETGSVDGSC